MNDAAQSPAAVPVSLVSLYEKRRKIQPRSVQGWFAGWRWALVWITQALFYGLPWLRWNDRPAVLFDLTARRFYIFDLVLYPQDFIFLTALLVLSAYALFFFTAVGGRLWCGYACPQTVYTEVFLWVERRFEGDRVARMKLDAAPWSLHKLLRRGGKQAVWIAVALITGFTFVGYFVPVRTLAGEIAAGTVGGWEAFWVLFYGFATYGNAGFLREQVCKYMCPYARFQGAMFDRDTLIITYDAERGEPRGKRAKDAAARTTGDCVDCTLCVQVCPTGIDIRDGLQYECIACAACIDVCNGVMDKIGAPRGLIRYTTENGLDQHLSKASMWRRVLRPRVILYGVVLVLLSAAFVASLSLRSPVKMDVVRDRASLARLVDFGEIENVYRLQLMNATERPQTLRLAVDGLPGLRIADAQPLTLEPAQARWVTVQVRIPPQAAAQSGPGAHPIHFSVQGEAVRVVEKSTFIVPR